ncbi:hypothetical protein ELUMI_v1c01170 [Williamsoniiplasma luminosum]|uniref:Uncharacterized protein n=1 Tax=Williamsoniiplasma luminosum TaxID=214888 RepID=A0A2K8NSL6_9MOLU|nr:hypothetical protein ELUMI_v1c01170 [Williamsoniiplasma luminosum]
MKTLVSIFPTLAISSSVVTSFAHATPKQQQTEMKTSQINSESNSIKKIFLKIEILIKLHKKIILIYWLKMFIWINK